MLRRTFATIVISAGLLAGCAGSKDLEEGQVYDPIEPANRMVFAVNETLDIFILQPTAYVYKTAVPDPVRDMVRNFLTWVSSPVVLANDLFQQDWANAEITAQRFVANAPLFGIIDNATGLGLQRQDEDFGQTLGHYGVGDGPYLMLPILGPSNGRDLVGRVVDYFLDPTRYVGDDDTNTMFQLGRRAVEGVDFRARNFEAINDLRETSVDYYARVRTIYKQRRDSLIKDGGPVSITQPTSSGEDEFNQFNSGAPAEQTGSKTTD